MFQEQLLPRIEEVFQKKIEKYHNEVKKYREEVVDFKVEVLGEIKGLRDEVTIVNHQYERTDKRVTRVEKKLKLAPIDF